MLVIFFVFTAFPGLLMYYMCLIQIKFLHFFSVWVLLCGFLETFCVTFFTKTLKQNHFQDVWLLEVAAAQTVEWKGIQSHSAQMRIQKFWKGGPEPLFLDGVHGGQCAKTLF